MDLLEMPSLMYGREKKKVFWDINTQQRRISLLVSPEGPNSCSEKPCELQTLDTKKVPSSIGRFSRMTHRASSCEEHDLQASLKQYTRAAVGR